MQLSHALMLGIVEGITEFLPISSTAHLILVGKLLAIPQTEVLKTFDIAIQLGAIMSILFLYAGKLLTERETLLRVVVAFIPTAILGAIFYPYIKELFDATLTIILALGIGGMVIILFERYHKERDNTISTLPIWKIAAIGCIQAFAFLPGVSRSGVSIIGGMLLGLTRIQAVEFSFLLALPVMLSATALDLSKSYHLLDSTMLMPFLVGFLTAFVTALFALRFLIRFVQHHNFTAFGVYRILIAIIFALFIL